MQPTDQREDRATIFGLLRHGQTEWNQLKRIQGTADSPLTAQGRERTKSWARLLENYHWDRIVASDQGRARTTVDILNAALHLPVLFDPRLREQGWGEWEGLRLPFVQERYAEELARRVARGWEFAAPGGESRRAVRDRSLAALAEAAHNWPGQKILVICHQGVVKAVLYSITGRKFVPGEDPLLHPDRMHLLQLGRDGFAPLQLNIPGPPQP